MARTAKHRDRVEVREISEDRSRIRLQEAEVFLPPDLAPTAVSDIIDIIDNDVWAVEEIFGFQFPTRPRVYLFPDDASYATALGSEASRVADLSGAVAQVLDNRTLVHVPRIRLSRPVTAVRHELVHLMLHQVSGGESSNIRTQNIPAWFNEGIARLAEETVEGFAPQARLSRYIAASRAQIGVVPQPRELWSGAQWLAAVDAAKRATDGAQLSPYHVAAQYARLLRDDAGGDEGLRRVYEFMRLGYSFDQAYYKATDRLIYTFANAAPELLKTLVPVLPGAAIEELEGAPVLVLYGLPKGVSVRVRIDGGGLGPLAGSGPTGPAGVLILQLPASPSAPLHVSASGPGVSFAGSAPIGR
jgi:hypothetical protein